jgi:hypothetical protein
VALELLESANPTPELVALVRELSVAGYTLALDDLVYDPAREPLRRSPPPPEQPSKRNDAGCASVVRRSSDDGRKTARR